MSCNCCSSSSSVAQTLSELDFERGIWFAAQHNDLKRVKGFLKKGICPSIEDESGYTALHYAARAGHIEMCQVLLAAGANVNAATRAGKATSLHRAATLNQIDVFNFLLDWKADPNAVDVDGKTVLHRALEGGNVDLAKEITKKFPALLDIKDNGGMTPRAYAIHIT